MTAIIEADGLVKLYPSDAAPLRAVDGVDLRVETGESVSVMGPSGCGKSTLLHLLGGLEHPDAGQLRLAGQSTAGLSEAQWARFRRTHIGFVFQAFHLVDELTAVENVELPALLAGTARRAARSRAIALLEQLCDAPCGETRYRALSAATSAGARSSSPGWLPGSSAALAATRSEEAAK